MINFQASASNVQDLLERFQYIPFARDQKVNYRQSRSLKALSYQSLEARELLAGDLFQSIVVNVDGTSHELTATNNTLPVNAGEQIQVESIKFNAEDLDGVFAAEGYISRLTDLHSPSSIDYSDGRFSARDANQAATGGEGTIGGLAEGWVAETGLDRLNLVLVHYTESGQEVADRFLINVQVGEADLEFDLETLEQIRSQDLTVGDQIQIPAAWTNSLDGLYHNYAEVDVYLASNPDHIVWAGSTVGNAGQDNRILGSFENTSQGDGFSQYWTPDTSGEYILKYYLDPEFALSETNEENNTHEIRVNVDADIELQVTNDHFTSDFSSLDVLSNDTGAGELQVVEFTQGQHGTVGLNNDGTLAYEPENGFIGRDKFTYTAADENGSTAVGVVSLDVQIELLVSSSVTGQVDQTIGLDIRTNAPLVYVTGVPAAATLSVGEKTSESSWLIANEDLDGLALESRESFPQGVDIEVTPVNQSYVAYDELTQSINIVIDSELQANDDIVIDSFIAQPWTFTFQIRNSTSEDRQFEFRIPDANYELTNLQLNGSTQDVTVRQSGNDILIGGILPAYQSVGGQQPNGFLGAIAATNGTPFVLSSLVV